MGKYKIAFNKKTSSIMMDLSGYFSDEDFISFTSDFIKISKRIKTNHAYLNLDCGKLLLYPCDVRAKLQALFVLYKQNGYRIVRIKLFKPQKELGRKFQELAKLVGLKLELIFVDMGISHTDKQVVI